MDKIDWKQKLSSRKLWAAIIGWATSLLAAFNVTDSTIARTAIIISGIGGLAVYMLAEGGVDRERQKSAGAETPTAATGNEKPDE